jgi:4,5-DOPA dioxygenase extradiol
MVGKDRKDLKKSERMPVLFIGHGSPMNVILKNSFTRGLENLGLSLPRPEAIMVISAHWLTSGTYVGCMERPKTIYDFYGFPDELYRIKYPCEGSPRHARMVTELSNRAQIKCHRNWGLDHASWAILKHIYPQADIPVFEMSLDYSYNEWNPKPLEYYYQLGSELKELRQKGVLIIGSGNMVHNLGLIDFQIDTKPYDWAVEFDEKLKTKLINRNHTDLVSYKNMGRTASLAVPTLDHYLPMIVVIGLQGKEESLTFIYEGIQNASISMRSFRIG